LSSHSHSHGAHHDRAQNRRLVATVLVLSLVYMVAEVVGGLWTGSLALLADAGHMLSDVASLGLTLFALWFASRPATARRTYGHSRAEILAALAQGVALVAVAILIAIEAVERLGEPPEVHGLGVIWIGTGGLVVNLVGLVLLERGRHESLNIRGAWLHLVSDALGSIGAITSGVVLWLFDWRWADPAASLAISALVLVSAWHLLRDAIDVLMETAPRHLDVDEIRRALGELPGVLEVHDLHVWSIGQGDASLSSHVVAAPETAPSELLRAIYELLGSRFGLGHATIQIEPESFAGLSPASVCEGACEEAAVAAEG